MTVAHSFAIDFITRKCTDDKGMALIYARITVDGERKEVSIKERISCSDWDGKAEMVRGKSMETKLINSAINDIRFKIKQKYRELQEIDALITAETVKTAYCGIHTQLKGHRLIELLDYYHKIWQPKLKRGGFKNIETTIKYLKAFLAVKFKSGDLFLSQLTMEFATDFEYYIRNNPAKASDPCLGNGLGKHMQRFKTIINWGVEIRWLQFNPIECYSCPLKRNRRQKLTIQDVFSLEKKLFTDETLALVKDMFLYSCYTGLAFVDAAALRFQDFEYDVKGKAWCNIYRTKSEGFCAIPLLTIPIAIINKYKNHAGNAASGKVFPQISHQHVNRSLQVIRAACEIETPMTFHVARHTFAKTVALKNGVPMETIQMMMGHTKITTTQIYAEVDEEKIANDMRGVEGKLNRKRNRIHEHIE